MVVVVVGEDPYAEGSGDRAKLELSPEDRALIDAAKRSGKPLVIVLLSGRPLILGDVARRRERAGRGLAAGDRGRGRRRRAVGAVQADRQALRARGRANMSQIPINVGDPRYAPLFPYGFGLSW